MNNKCFYKPDVDCRVIPRLEEEYTYIHSGQIRTSSVDRCQRREIIELLPRYCYQCSEMEE